jgi:hypothetical protein
MGERLQIVAKEDELGGAEPVDADPLLPANTYNWEFGSFSLLLVMAASRALCLCLSWNHQFLDDSFPLSSIPLPWCMVGSIWKGLCSKPTN